MDEIDPDRLFDFNDMPPVEVKARAPIVVARDPTEPVLTEEENRAVIAATGIDANAPVTVSFKGEVKRLLDETERLIQFAQIQDRKSGQWRIHNPMLFEKAIARRQSVLSAAVKLHNELWSQHAQREFYRLLVQTIVQADKPTAHRLIDALRQINSPMLEAIASEERMAL